MLWLTFFNFEQVYTIQTSNSNNLSDENVVLGGDCNNILQVTICAMALRLPIGIVVPMLTHASKEKVIVTLIPIAKEIFSVALIIAWSIIQPKIVIEIHQLIVAVQLVSRVQIFKWVQRSTRL